MFPEEFHQWPMVPWPTSSPSFSETWMGWNLFRSPMPSTAEIIVFSMPTFQCWDLICHKDPIRYNMSSLWRSSEHINVLIFRLFFTQHRNSDFASTRAKNIMHFSKSLFCPTFLASQVTLDTSIMDFICQITSHNQLHMLHWTSVMCFSAHCSPHFWEVE